MKRLFPFLWIVLLCACNDSEKEKEYLSLILVENIITNTNFIKQESENAYKIFKYQAEDPKTREKALIWLPAIEKIHAFSDSLVQYMQNLKGMVDADKRDSDIFKHTYFLHNLYDSLLSFQSNILNIDPELKEQFKNAVFISNLGQNTVQKNFSDFKQIVLSIQSNQGYIAILAVLENRIRNLEHNMISFCSQKITFHGCFLEKHIPLLNQDKSIVAPNDTIEITVATGRIITEAKTDMTVQGKKLSSNELGLIAYKFSASDKKGKHFIPITIEFADEAGIKKKVSNTISYTVQ
ncbi:MAG: hypothetical protein KF862_20780 [Chitinophagaceae bacterium]|nr:hypothetical protein [Chitinophagaceae bacterium]